MKQIPTLYSNYQELMLDLDIFGKIISTPQQSIQDMKDALFEEFKLRKPLPTLTDKRYELSEQVSQDYKIAYNRELEMQDYESLIDLESKSDLIKDFSFEDLTPLVPEVKALFSYEQNIKDIDRKTILEKYSMETGEEFSNGVAQTEELFNSVKEDKSLILSDSEIDNLGKDLEDDDVEYSEEEYDTDETFEEDDYDEFEDTEINESEDSDSEESEYEEDEDDFIDETSFEDSDEDEYEEDSDDEYEYEADLDDEAEYEDSDEDEYEEDSDDEEYEEEDETADEDDEDDEYEEADDDEYEEDDLDINSYIEDSEESEGDFEIEFEETTSQINTVDESPPVITQQVNIPITPVEINNNIVKEEVIDRSLEPTDIRQFLRKHPRSDYDFVLKYFTKKQINDALKIGKIIKKGNILKLP